MTEQELKQGKLLHIKRVGYSLFSTPEEIFYSLNGIHLQYYFNPTAPSQENKNILRKDGVVMFLGITPIVYPQYLSAGVYTHHMGSNMTTTNLYKVLYMGKVGYIHPDALTEIVYTEAYYNGFTHVYNPSIEPVESITISINVPWDEPVTISDNTVTTDGCCVLDLDDTVGVVNLKENNISNSIDVTSWPTSTIKT